MQKTIKERDSKKLIHYEKEQIRESGTAEENVEKDRRNRLSKIKSYVIKF